MNSNYNSKQPRGYNTVSATVKLCSLAAKCSSQSLTYEFIPLMARNTTSLKCCLVTVCNTGGQKRELTQVRLHTQDLFRKSESESVVEHHLVIHKSVIMFLVTYCNIQYWMDTFKLVVMLVDQQLV